MIDKVISAVNKYAMLEKGDGVIIALSGGADSVALLYSLYSLKEKYNLRLYAAHLNHLIRGAEADRDESFCRALCKKYDIELFVKKEDIRRLAKSRKISEELCGRNERYAFFEQLSQKLNSKVATAHTASDNAETVLFNIARGTSLGGLRGILPVRGKIIRPLIFATRLEVERFCGENGLEFVTDSTNLSDDYTRNCIRHNAIPVFKRINPAFEQAVIRMSESCAQIYDDINARARLAAEESRCPHGFCCDSLLSRCAAEVKNAIAFMCREYADFSAEQRHIELILNIMKNSGTVELGKNSFASAKQGVLRFYNTDENSDKELFNRPYKGGDSFVFGGRLYTVSKDEEVEQILSGAVFRTRRGGDSFEAPGRNVNKALRKLMNELKIPSERRDGMLLLAEGGTVLWCEGIGVSAKLFKRNISEEQIFI